MKYHVNWLTDAENNLASIYLAAADKNQITRAAHALDQRLSRGPEQAGESRDHWRRIIFIPPLGAYFRVHSDDLRVDVIRVFLT